MEAADSLSAPLAPCSEQSSLTIRIIAARCLSSSKSRSLFVLDLALLLSEPMCGTRRLSDWALWNRQVALAACCSCVKFEALDSWRPARWLCDGGGGATGLRWLLWRLPARSSRWPDSPMLGNRRRWPTKLPLWLWSGEACESGVRQLDLRLSSVMLEATSGGW